MPLRWHKGGKENVKTWRRGGSFPTLLPQALALGALSFGGASLLGRAGALQVRECDGR